MHIPSVKKILLFVLILALLITIPIIIFIISQQKSKTTVTPSSTLTFVPATQSANAGDDVSVDISMDPGSNSVSMVKLLVAYDATKLATTEAGFTSNTSSFPSIVEGPTYGDGTIAVTLAIGANSPSIQTTTKVATITFKALEPTDTTPTQLTFDTQTQVLSSNATAQNVLSSASPATVNIAGPLETPTPFPTTSETPLTPTPTTTGQGSTVTTNTQQTGPVCISFTADRPTTGTAPFNVNFTLIATDSAAVIAKATFDFGDGQKKDLTSADGLGDNPITVNALTSHIYSNAGTFTATGSITDVDGTVSDTGTCSLVFNISTESAQTSTTGGQLTPIPSPLPPTGNSSFTAILAFSVILTIIGAVLLLSL